MHQEVADTFGPVPTAVADRLIPQLLDVWALASLGGQTDAAVSAARELDRLLRQPVSL